MYVKQAVFAVLMSTSLTVLALPENVGNLHGLKAGRDDIVAREPAYPNLVPRAVGIDERSNVEARKSKPKKNPPKAKTTEAVKTTKAETTSKAEKTTSKEESPATSSKVEPTTSKAAPTTASSSKVESSTAKPSTSTSADAISSHSVTSSLASSEGVTSSHTTSAETAITSSISDEVTSLSSVSDAQPTILSTSQAEEASTASATTSPADETQSASDPTETDSDPNEEPSSESGGSPLSDVDWYQAAGAASGLIGGLLSTSSADAMYAATGDPVAAQETLGAAGVPEYTSQIATGGDAQVTGMPVARRARPNGMPRYVETTTFITSTKTAPAGGY